MAKHTVQSFDGVRIHLPSPKPYKDLLASLLQDIGETPVNLDDLEQKYSSWQSYEAQAEKLAGPSGFMLFGLIDHGSWMAKAGAFRKSIRVILGNPALAITMLSHDLRAGLFAPVELLLLEEDDDRSSLMYVRPSSLMVVDGNKELLAAAENLDTKLMALAVKTVGE
jgi:uncharacterized protein (DUF302 family)